MPKKPTKNKKGHLSPAEFAKRCGVSQSAVSLAIKRGDIIKGADGYIDKELPGAVYFRTKPKSWRNRKRREKPKWDQLPPAGELPGGYHPGGEIYDPQQKVYEDVRLKAAQADLKSLEYANKLKVIVDLDALEQRFGVFRDFLLNGLIYMPESVCDMLWLKAQGAEHPERIIEETLKDVIAEIIEQAKRAAAAVVPPVEGTKYIMIRPGEAGGDGGGEESDE